MGILLLLIGTSIFIPSGTKFRKTVCSFWSGSNLWFDDNIIWRLAKDHELSNLIWLCGRLKGPKIKNQQMKFYPKQLGFRPKILSWRKWKGLWSYHVLTVKDASSFYSSMHSWNSWKACQLPTYFCLQQSNCINF